MAISQTTLNRGDVMVLGVIVDDCSPTIKNSIYLVSFKPITNGTTIDLTDNGWERQNPNRFGSSEGFFRFQKNTNSGTIPAGQVFRLNMNQNGNPTNLQNPDWDYINASSVGSFDLRADGDQFFVMQGGNWTNTSGNNATYSGRILTAYNTKSTWIATNSTTNSAHNRNSNIHPDTRCYHITSPIDYNNFRYYSGNTSTSISQGEWLVRILNTADVSNNGNWSNASNCSDFDAKIFTGALPIRTNIPSQEVCVNELLTDLEVVDEPNVVTYQWYRNTIANTTGGTPVGTNSNIHTPSNTLIGTYYYYCVMTINLPLNGTPNTTDCQFISNLYEVTVNPNPVTSPVIPL